VLRGIYKVIAIPPVARIPQRTVFGEDMMNTTLYLIYLVGLDMSGRSRSYDTWK
jgi:hypothetical protein